MKKIILILLFLSLSSPVFAGNVKSLQVSVVNNQSLQNQINALKKENQDLWFEITVLKNELKRIKKESKNSRNTQFTPVPVMIVR